MSEPQIWTIIGILAASFFGSMTLMSTQVTRTIRAEVGGLRGEMNGQINGLRGEMNGQIRGLRGEVGGLRGEMNARFEAVDAKFDAVDVKFDALNQRFDGLDCDVQYLMKRDIEHKQ